MNNLNLYLGMAFLSATVGTSLFKGHLKRDLVAQLTNEEIKVYDKIRCERRNIYLVGLVLGLVASYLYIKYMNKSYNKVQNGLTVVAITGVVNYFFYNLYPKSKYMLEYLDTQKENKAWLKIYKGMKLRYHVSFLAGLVGAYFLSQEF